MKALSVLPLYPYRNCRRHCFLALMCHAFLSVALVVSLREPTLRAQEPIDFSLQIRPILSEYCFHCHGPDESHRQAGLRLDLESSTVDSTSRPAAVTPGNHLQSELWKRLISDAEDEVMPPPSTHKSLSNEQRELIKRWINAGAPWGEHWSFVPPTQRPLPKTAKEAWGDSPIDAWVLDKLRAKNLAPAPPADSYTLCRRLHLDLIGLPPTRERSRAFAEQFAVNSKIAIEQLVDELLSRTAFGEHWARVWLDLARYADTKGYEKDLGRDMWPFRDWVVAAYNQDMPLDQFTLEQLAGDLLPQSTESQRVATAFHRTTLSNDEGGTDDEEFRIAAVKDRVDTTMQVWMGLTMGCAKCHSHKYDPISIQEYYQLFAILNQTEDADRYDDEPKLPLPNFIQQRKILSLELQRAEVLRKLNEQRSIDAIEQNKRWYNLLPKNAKSVNGSEFELLADHSVLAKGTRADKDTYEIEFDAQPGTYASFRLEALTSKQSPNDPEEAVGRSPIDPNFVLSELSTELLTPAGTTTRIVLATPKADVEQGGWPIANAIDGKLETGWAIGDKKRESHWAIFSLEQPLVLEKAGTIRVSMSQQFGGGLLLHRVRCSLAVSKMDELLPVDSDASRSLASALSELDKGLAQERDSIPKLPVMRELGSGKQRVTKLHIRGSFLDQGDVVQPSVPKAFGDLPANKSIDRVALAQWLVSPSNPLTARVMVNRVWSQLFGRGLVETEEDFGSQGTLPSHPELLDSLAVQYRDQLGWSHKRLLKTIVLSHTYQQSYLLDSDRQSRDPRNVWLSRGARHRLSAEAIRDSSLQIAGLLSEKRGGPPVMPPQPDGLWRSTYNATQWTTSKNEDRYRRGIYTYWKRTSPYPSMETFDSSTREVCQIRRIATNTPLQALVTLNDPVYVEASAALAQRVLRVPAQSDGQRIDLAIELATGRPAKGGESQRLLELLAKSRNHFSQNKSSSSSLLVDCKFERDAAIDDIELASWSVVTSVIMNLDEVLTKS